MKEILEVLTRLVRGRDFLGESEGANAPVLLALLAAAIVLLMLHGAAMGAPRGARQALASAVKLPAVPLLGLLIATPAMMMLAYLFGATLGAARFLALLLLATLLAGAIALSFAPVILFFGFSADYRFVKRLNATVLGLAFVIGFGALGVALQSRGEAVGLGSFASLLVFLGWLVLFCFVSAQLSWLLRPFIGDPRLPFCWRRAHRGDINVFSALLGAEPFEQERP